MNTHVVMEMVINIYLLLHAVACCMLISEMLYVDKRNCDVVHIRNYKNMSLMHV